MLHSQALRQLMPVELGPVHDADLTVEGAALDAAEASADRLLSEMFPESAYLLLPDWERVLGITPQADDTVAARQARCLAKLRAAGRMDLAYFIGLAADLGVTIEIREMAPFMAGLASAGYELMPAEGFFVWLVKVTASPGQYFRAGASAAGESLGASLIAMVEALFQELKPAHTCCLFQQ